MTSPTPPKTPQTRAGFAAVIGAPNAGKSTLVNALVGEKISIVTHKVQTTRFQVRGIAMLDETQIVLIDTPGIFDPKQRLDRSMVHAAWTGADDADAIVHVVDAAAFGRAKDGEGNAQDKLGAKDTERVIKGLQKRDRQSRNILVLNKIDQMDQSKLLPIIEQLNATGCYSEVFLISATSGEGMDALIEGLKNLMPAGPYHYPPEQAADIPMRLMAAEVTREKIFLRLHDELPYASMVETEKWEDRKDGSVKIDQIIYVKRPSQKSIVLGKGGSSIKAIGASSRKELEDMLQRRVHLFLFVKVRENWHEDRARYSEAGLEFDV